MIVVDNNLIVAFAARMDEYDLAEAVQRKDREWIAPPLWQSEFRNVLLKAIRKGSLSHKTALDAYAFAWECVDTVPVATSAVLRLAERHGLTAYDAEYAALAEQMEIPCLSFDKDLLAVGLAIHPKDF